MRGSSDKWQALLNICWDTAGGALPKQLLCKRIAGFHIITVSGLNKLIISAWFFFSLVKNVLPPQRVPPPCPVLPLSPSKRRDREPLAKLSGVGFNIDTGPWDSLAGGQASFTHPRGPCVAAPRVLQLFTLTLMSRSLLSPPGGLCHPK
jgi:hypothetical protein